MEDSESEEKTKVLERFNQLIASFETRFNHDKPEIEHQQIVTLIQNLKETVENSQLYMFDSALKNKEGSFTQIHKGLEKLIEVPPDIDQPDIPNMASQLSARALKSILCHLDSGTEEPEEAILLCTENRMQMEVLVKTMQKLIELEKLNLKTFVTLFTEITYLPLEVLWFFYVSKIVPISVYLYSKRKQLKVIEKFVSSFLSLTSIPEKLAVEGRKRTLCDQELSQSFLAQNILRDILAVLLCICSSDDAEQGNTLADQDCKSISSIILEAIVQRTTSRLVKACSFSTSNLPGGVHYCYCKESVGPLIIPSKALNHFTQKQLEHIVTYRPDTKLESAIKYQVQWVAEPSFYPLTSFLTNLFSVMDTEQTVNTFKDVLLNGEVNWKLLLISISTFVKNIKESASLMQDLVRWFLQKSFATSSQELLVGGLLVARQCCAAKCRYFTSYADWFGQTFGSDSGHLMPSASSPSAFQFLISFFTEIIPHEPGYCLRVHVNKVPVAPPNCKTLLTEYIELAKTRLCDLGEASVMGLFDFETTVEQDILKVISHFEETGELMRVLLDASLFRTSYFTGVFLPSLLTPCKPPSAPDARQPFISKLHSAGKIPSAMFKKYLKRCEEYRENVEPLKMEKIENPLSNFEESLKFLSETILTHPDSPSQLKTLLNFEDALSKVSFSLEHLSSYELLEESDYCAMVVKLYLDTFNNCIRTCSEALLLKWPKSYIMLIQSFPQLWDFMLSIVFQSFKCEESIPDYKMKSLAILIFIVESLGPSFSQMKAEESGPMNTLARHVSEVLGITTRAEMLQCYKFGSDYIKYGESTLSNQNDDEVLSSAMFLHAVPALLIKKFMFVHLRLQSSPIQIVESVFHPSEQWSDFLHKNQMSAKEWLDAEINVTEDILEEGCRQLHLVSIATTQYLTVPGSMISHLLDSILTAKLNALENNFLLLLTNLLVSVPPAGNTSWLLQKWQASKKASDNKFNRVFNRLPSWLLFVNKCGDIPNGSVVSELSKFITSRLRNSLSERGFLCRSFVMHILVSLTEAFSLKPHLAVDALSELISSCPAYHMGLLVHARYINVMLKSITSKAVKERSNVVIKLKHLLSLTFERLNKNVFTLDSAAVCLQQKEWELGLLLWYGGDILNPKLCHIESSEANSNVVYKWVVFFAIVEIASAIQAGRIYLKFDGEIIGMGLGQRYNDILALLKNGCSVFQVFDFITPSEPITSLPVCSQILMSLAYMLLMMQLDFSVFVNSSEEALVLCQSVLSSYSRWFAIMSNPEATDVLIRNLSKSTDVSHSLFNFLEVDFTKKLSKIVSDFVKKVKCKYNINLTGEYVDIWKKIT